MNTHYCTKCEKTFKPLGIARHRAMHREKKENIRIITNGYIITDWFYATDKNIIIGAAK